MEKLTEQAIEINPYRLFTGAFIPNWLLERPDISNGAKLCYARLCQFSGKDGKCFPKQSLLASELGVNERSVRYYLSELERFKLIKVHQQGLSLPNHYSFLAHEWMGFSIAGPELQALAGHERQNPAVPSIDEENQERSTPYSPPKGGRHDQALILVKAFRDRFDLHPKHADPKGTLREIEAAKALLVSGTAEDILDLASRALNDRFSGNRKNASSLRNLLANFSELKAQFHFGNGKQSVQTKFARGLNENHDPAEAEAQIRAYRELCENGVVNPSKMPQDDLGGMDIPPSPPAKAATPQS